MRHWMLGLILLTVMIMTIVPMRKTDATINSLLPSRETTLPFILYLHEQADLSAAYQISDWNERGQYVYDQLRASAESSQMGLRQAWSQRSVRGTVTKFEPLWIVNAILVEGDTTALNYFASFPEVAAIESPLRPEFPPEPIVNGRSETAISWGVEYIHAPQVWQKGIDGKGIVIGVIDTGIDWEHPALKEHYRGWDGQTATHDYNWFNPEPESAEKCTDPAIPCPESSHGTHVTGIAVGGDADNQIGVAPGAKWIHALGCCPSETALLASLQWMIAPTDLQGNNPKPELRPHIVNNSWGGAGGRQTYHAALQALHASGIVVTVSTGNSGPFCGSIGSPPDDRFALSVGNFINSGDISRSSSRGPSPFSGVGVDVAAPGTGIFSSLPSGQYGSTSGTSMAAPHLAGMVALMLQANPTLIGQVDMVREWVRRSADSALAPDDSCPNYPGDQTPNTAFGWGRIDAERAVSLVTEGVSWFGRIESAAGEPIAEAQIGLTNGVVTVTQTTGKDGSATLIVPPDLYTVTASATGYQPVTITDLSITDAITAMQTVSLTLLPTVTLSGIVVRSDTQQPLVDVELVWREGGVTTTTDANGQYQLTLPIGSAEIALSHSGYTPTQETITVTKPMTQTFQLMASADYTLVTTPNRCALPYRWEDATGGDPLSLGDDDRVMVTLPFSFPFYETLYDSVYVGSNGFLTFGRGELRPHFVVPFISPPNNVIYGFGEDLNSEKGLQGEIYTQLQADGAFVIEYHAVEHWPKGNPETFQIKLYPNGQFQLQYETVSDPLTALAGVENGSGTQGTVWTKQLTNGLAVSGIPYVNGENLCADGTTSIVTNQIKVVSRHNVPLLSMVLFACLVLIGLIRPIRSSRL